MSKRLQTVQQSLSGLPSPLVNKNFDPVLAKRDPTVNDTGYPLTQTWLNKLTNNYWILVEVAAGIATWQLMGAGGGSLNTLTGDDAIPVLPNAGNINIQGDGAGAIAFSSGGLGQLNAQVLVDNTTIQIAANKLEAIPGGIVSALQFDPDVGANVSPVAGILGVPGIGGNQTLNGGAGILQFNNRRWLSRFVVDQSAVPGSDAEFTTIQAAINAAFAAGGGVVMVRPGTYTENLTIQPGVDIISVSGDGRVPSPPVTIVGTHTMSSNGFTVISGISFTNAAGDTFTVSSAAASFTLLALKFCSIASSGRASVTSSTAGFTLMVFFDSRIDSNLVTCEVGDGSAVNFQESTASSGTAVCLNLSGLGCNSDVYLSELAGSTACVNMGNVTSVLTAEYSTFNANTNATILFSTAASANLIHCTHTSNNATTFYIDGAAGTYTYGDDVIKGGTATGIAPGITQTRDQWRPRATSGTSVTAFAGTASFDDTQFTVTDGFVQITALPILITLSLTTVGAVTVNSADIPITANHATLVNANFAVMNATATLGAGNLASGTARDNAGVVTIINGDFVDVALNEDAALAATDYNLITGVGASSIRVQVVGVAGETLDWKVQISLITSP